MVKSTQIGVLEAWLRERCNQDNPEVRCSIGALHDAFNTAARHERPGFLPWPRVRFARAMAELGFPALRLRNGERAVVGLALRDAA